MTDAVARINFRNHFWKYWWIAAFLLAFSFWGGRSLWDSSEARYAEAAREMMVAGDLILPRLSGEPHITKPAFAYWMIWAGMEVFGVNAWGARFFLSLAYFGSILCVYNIALEAGYARKLAIVSALVFATSPLVFSTGHVITTDGFLLFWISLGVLSYLKTQTTDSEIWRILFWFCFGMAFFTKGPPGWLPLIAIAYDRIARRRSGEGHRVLSIPGILIFVLVAFWWYVAVDIRLPGSLKYFLGKEVKDRVLTTDFGRNSPPYIYFVHFLWGMGPWVVGLIFLPRKFLPLNWSKKPQIVRSSVVWFTSSLVIFLIAKSRMPLYIAPLFIPLSLWISPAIYNWLKRKSKAAPGVRFSLLLAASAYAILLLAFTLWRDDWPKAKTMRPLGVDLQAYLADLQGDTYVSWAFTDPKFSVNFYSDKTLLNADNLHSNELPMFQEPYRQQGARVFFLIPSKEIKRFKKRGWDVTVHLADNKFSLIELEDE